MDHARIARDLVAAYGTAQRLARLTETEPGFTLGDAYRIAHLVRDLRVQRGEVPVGRKIGGTNPAMYHLTGATGPIWGFMYNTTTVRELPGGHGEVALGPFQLPRIEPELMLHLSRAPEPGMEERDLLGCIDRVAHGLELVFSPFAGWPVPPPDATAAYGLHFGAVIGPWVDITADRAGWGERLKTLEITLTGSNGEVRSGVGANALGSPVLALKAMVDEIGSNPGWTPLAVGEVITTGTLTELMPMVAGESWSTTISGAPLSGLTVTLT